MNDAVVLMYMKDGVLYPVALTKDQNDTLQFTTRLLGPLKVVFSEPQGKAINLVEQK